jgi:hypothetical protein
VNGDDCICVKGEADGSGIYAENWLIENSTISGEGLTIGSLYGGSFLVRNHTWRNLRVEHSHRGIYIKADSDRSAPNRIYDVLYQNITVVGPTLESPVWIGPVHQFFGGECDATWPWAGAGSCAVTGRTEIDVTIDGLRISKSNGIPLLGHVSDFIIIGNNETQTNVRLSNIHVEGSTHKACSEPPLSLTGTCINACFAANVTTDGSYPIECTPWGSREAAGTCAPLVGSFTQRCQNGNVSKDRLCRSGHRCA